MTETLSQEQLQLDLEFDTQTLLQNYRFTKGLRIYGEKPAFRHFIHEDKNPLSGNLKRRDIYDPNKSMRRIHDRLTGVLKVTELDLPYATGGMEGCSPAKNLLPHADNRFFYLLDLEDAYSQVDFGELAEQLERVGVIDNKTDAITFLETFCKPPNSSGLCTGAPSSPVLFNLACKKMDDLLGAVCEEYDITYTRYLDDLTFSISNEGRFGQKKRLKILEIIREHGFSVHQQKTKIRDLHKGPVRVCGLQLNRSGKWQLPTEYYAVIEGFLDRVSLQSGKLDDHTIAKIAGYKGLMISMHDPRRNGELTQREDSLMERIHLIQEQQKLYRKIWKMTPSWLRNKN